MKYLDIIEQMESFKYSGNLKYDFFKDNKIIEYISTKNSLNILKEIFNNVTQDVQNKQTLRLIYGAYRTGVYGNLKV